jgi:hypothetical protein
LSDPVGIGRQADLDRRLASAAILLAWLAPRLLVEDGPTVCPLRRLTGLPCPACGLTRSVNAATHLRIRRSVSAHPLGFPVLGALVLVAAGRWQPSVEGPRTSRWVIGGSVVMVAAWVVRLARLARLTRREGALDPNA